MVKHDVTDTPASVAARVRAQLEAEDRSGRWLARQMDRDQMWVQRRLAGDVEFSAADIALVARILRVPVSRFFGEAPESVKAAS